ncbi:MAG TPA: AMP-binding protein [Candidatus Methylomirabilis sp.]|nr:AMP-binding protein [Candidatus Methylomirabilis sp.]
MARGSVDRSPGYYDPAVETMAPEVRREFLKGRLGETLRRAAAQTTHLARRLEAAGLKLDDLREPENLFRLPPLPKRELPELQRQAPPFGGLAAVRPSELQRIFMSPGPIFDPEGSGPEYWRMARALHAAGFRRGDIVLNTFAYHLTPAGSMLDEGLVALGCVVVPMGGGNTDVQVQVLRDLQATGYVGTPSFLHTILQRAEEGGITPLQDLSLEVALVSGGMLPESLRTTMRERYGVGVTQAYASADLGLIAYECAEQAGMHVAEDLILQIGNPETGRPVADGTAGEVVVTTFNPVYPLVRFGTGDLSILDRLDCACGRTTPRLTRILGRTDDAAKIRGMFVHPSQLDAVMAEMPDVVRYQLVVRRRGFEDDLALRVETAGGLPAALAATLEARVREAIKLRARVEIAPAGTLCSDAKKILDERTWE